MDLLTHHLGKGMFLILMLSLPCVLTAASVGLVVGIIQAVTQVQEQTISAAPKIILVFTLIIFGGGVMLNMLSNYIHESVVIAFEQIPSSGHRLMPPRETDPGRLRAQKFYHQRYQHPQRGFNAGMSSAPSMGGSSGSEYMRLDSAQQPNPQAGIAEEIHLRQNQ